ncbi:XdhC family protein [Gilvibacter sp.]|uniref:XdhC family protein n=1 Tax=Gilvibacter sp. TaxID=2729997 RepID=UPI0025C1C375|nr:XdhC family protein [Gilvibacter sp.]NQX77985.1 XdhC family protein [Gilvibacter sp.]
MLHELIHIFNKATEAAQADKKSVLASVVALEGSSYRRPGVRMLILEDGEMFGAVSGGCVEKDILRQADEVFKTGTPKMMHYDGRYRLGCEGLLYILIEPVTDPQQILNALKAQDHSRESFKITSNFSNAEGLQNQAQSVFNFSDEAKLAVHGAPFDLASEETFTQTITPSIRLTIIGSEHDAVALTQLAAAVGFRVEIIAPLDDHKSLQNFPGATNFYHLNPEQITPTQIDDRTAVVLMTHSFSKDLKYLGALIDSPAAYIGLLGPKKRREKLFDGLLEHYPEVAPEFIEMLHGPAGINIGAETAYEIGISIIAEILAVMRGQEPQSLKNKKSGIHD